MAEAKETVVIQLSVGQRRGLGSLLASKLRTPLLGTVLTKEFLGGFELPAGWPIRGKMTLPQLVAVATKLKMQIIITGLVMTGDE